MRTQVRRSTPTTITGTFYDDETVVTLDAAPTVSIVDANGDSVTPGAVSGTGPSTFTLPAISNCDLLTVTWTGDVSGVERTLTTYIEVVGGFWFELAELRADKALADTSLFPTSVLRDARQQAEDLLEHLLGASFVPRFKRQTLDGDGTDTLFLDTLHARTLLLVSVGGTSQTLSEFKLYPHKLFWDGTTFTKDERNVVVEYEHGYDAPDGEVRRAALQLAKHIALATAGNRIPDRAATMTTQEASFNLVVAGDRRPTGLPEVDALIASRTERLPGFA